MKKIPRDIKFAQEGLLLLSRMLITESSLGIDFKQNHLILTLLRKSFRKIGLVDYGVYPLPSEDQKEEREAQAIGLINTFISEHQIRKERISIAIPREKTVVRFIRLPIATRENLRKVLEYEVPKYTPFEKGEIYFDYCILKEEKEWLHLFAVFAKKADVDPYLSLLKKIGIQPIAIQIPSIAAINLFFYNEGPVEGETSVLVDLTEPYFEMDLIQGKDWRESFHLPLPREAKELKLTNTFMRSGEEVRSPSKSTFFVYGLSADETILTHLMEVGQIKGILSLPMNHIDIEEGVSKPYKICASMGVALKGLIKPRVDLNLLPLEMRKKVRQIGKPLFIFLTSFALFLCLTWGIGIFVHYWNELDAVNTEIKKRRPEVEAVEKLQKQKEELGREIFELEKIKSGEISKIEILRELTQLLPTTAWVWNFKYNGKEIEISGFADSASDLIPLLDRSPLFEKVEFMAPVTKERQMRPDGDKEKERFKIKARIEGRKM